MNESFSSLQFAANVMKLEIDPVRHREKSVPKIPIKNKNQSPEFANNQEEDNFFEKNYETDKSG